MSLLISFIISVLVVVTPVVALWFYLKPSYDEPLTKCYCEDTMCSYCVKRKLEMKEKMKKDGVEIISRCYYCTSLRDSTQYDTCPDCGKHRDDEMVYCRPEDVARKICSQCNVYYTPPPGKTHFGVLRNGELKLHCGTCSTYTFPKDADKMFVKLVEGDTEMNKDFIAKSDKIVERIAHYTQVLEAILAASPTIKKGLLALTKNVTKVLEASEDKTNG